MKLPVLVFLHGGAYYEGSSDSKELSPDYLMDQDIILVTLNYRLNIFGEQKCIKCITVFLEHISFSFYFK